MTEEHWSVNIDKAPRNTLLCFGHRRNGYPEYIVGFISDTGKFIPNNEPTDVTEKSILTWTPLPHSLLNDTLYPRKTYTIKDAPYRPSKEVAVENNWADEDGNVTYNGLLYLEDGTLFRIVGFTHRTQGNLKCALVTVSKDDIVSQLYPNMVGGPYALGLWKYRIHKWNGTDEYLARVGVARRRFRDADPNKFKANSHDPYVFPTPPGRDLSSSIRVDVGDSTVCHVNCPYNNIYDTRSQCALGWRHKTETNQWFRCKRCVLEYGG